MDLELHPLIKIIEEEWICPITRMPIKDPVVTMDGHSYQRQNIVHWLKSQRKAPKTNLPLQSTQVIPNYTLKSLIQKLNHQLPKIFTKQHQLTLIIRQLQQQIASLKNQLQFQRSRHTTSEQIYQHELKIKKIFKNHTQEKRSQIKELREEKNKYQKLCHQLKVKDQENRRLLEQARENYLDSSAKYEKVLKEKNTINQRAERLFENRIQIIQKLKISFQSNFKFIGHVMQAIQDTKKYQKQMKKSHPLKYQEQKQKVEQKNQQKQKYSHQKLSQILNQNYQQNKEQKIVLQSQQNPEQSQLIITQYLQKTIKNKINAREKNSFIIIRRNRQRQGNRNIIRTRIRFQQEGQSDLQERQRYRNIFRNRRENGGNRENQESSIESEREIQIRPLADNIRQNQGVEGDRQANQPNLANPLPRRRGFQQFLINRLAQSRNQLRRLVQSQNRFPPQLRINRVNQININHPNLQHNPQNPSSQMINNINASQNYINLNSNIFAENQNPEQQNNIQNINQQQPQQQLPNNEQEDDSGIYKQLQAIRWLMGKRNYLQINGFYHMACSVDPQNNDKFLCGVKLIVRDSHIPFEEFFQHSWRQLSFLDIALCQIDDQKWSLFIQNAHKFQGLVMIHANINRIKTIKQQELQKFPHLMSIRLQNNPLSPQSIKQIMNYKRAHPNIKIVQSADVLQQNLIENGVIVNPPDL